MVETTYLFLAWACTTLSGGLQPETCLWRFPTSQFFTNGVPTDCADVLQILPSWKACTTLIAVHFDAVNDADMRNVRVHAHRWTGSITIPETTAYTFAAGADDGVRLVIDGEAAGSDARIQIFHRLVAQNERTSGLCNQETQMLSAGDVVLEKQGFSGVSYEFRTITLTAGRSTSRLVWCCISATASSNSAGLVTLSCICRG